MAVRTLPIDTELVAYAGTTLRRLFRWKPDGKIGQDFTGWTGLLLIGPPRGTALVEVTAPDPELILDSAGQIIINLSPTHTQSLPAGPYTYTVDLTDPGGVVTRFLRGRLVVIRDLDRAAP